MNSTSGFAVVTSPCPARTDVDTNLGGIVDPVWEAQPGPPAEETEAAARSQPSSISGYMDFHFNNPENDDPILDFHRFVLLFTHSFSDRIRFVSELELEHAVVEGLEEKGELELEQAYVDFLIARQFNVRAGMLLAPVGIINERHEPPVFHGVERPFVDTVIIPTTWFDAGAGVHGEFWAGFRYRLYAMAPLDAAEFSADEGLRGGRQKGSRANARRLAGTGRFEYVGATGLALGASFWSGDTGFSFPRIDSSVTLGEVDGRYRLGELELRGQYAHVFLEGMGGVEPGAPADRRRQSQCGRTDAGFLSGVVVFRAALRGAPRVGSVRSIRELRYPIPYASRLPATQAVRP